MSEFLLCFVVVVEKIEDYMLFNGMDTKTDYKSCKNLECVCVCYFCKSNDTLILITFTNCLYPIGTR